MAQIIVMDGPGVGTTFELTADNIIGSGSDCNIRLQTPSVSPQHAIIVYKEGVSTIIPAATTAVNGQVVSKARELIHGDMITVEDVMLLYGEGSGEGSTIQQQTFFTNSATVKAKAKSNKSLQKILQDVEKTRNAEQYKKVLAELESFLKYHLEHDELNINEVLEEVLEIIKDEIPADRGVIFLKDPKANKLYPIASIS